MQMAQVGLRLEGSLCTSNLIAIASIGKPVLLNLDNSVLAEGAKDSNCCRSPKDEEICTACTLPTVTDGSCHSRGIPSPIKARILAATRPARGLAAASHQGGIDLQHAPGAWVDEGGGQSPQLKPQLAEVPEQLGHELLTLVQRHERQLEL